MCVCGWVGLHVCLDKERGSLPVQHNKLSNQMNVCCVCVNPADIELQEHGECVPGGESGKEWGGKVRH